MMGKEQLYFMYVLISCFAGDFLTEDMSHGEEGMITKTLQGALVHLVTYNWSQFFEVEYRVKKL